MDLREKRKQEIEAQKEQRKEEVVVAAIEVFKAKGIENAKMTDVAVEAQVGVASVYRYFKTKPELVIEAATMYWKREIEALYSQYASADFTKQSGIEQVRAILEVFLYLYQQHPAFLKFIHEFDNYVVKEQIGEDKLADYEQSIINVKGIMGEAFNAGYQDGSISKRASFDQFYDTITHTLISLCQKLLLRGVIINSDRQVDGEMQIHMVIDMAVHFIRSGGEEI